MERVSQAIDVLDDLYNFGLEESDTEVRVIS